jgi:hypothetical protein
MPILLSLSKALVDYLGHWAGELTRAGEYIIPVFDYQGRMI